MSSTQPTTPPQPTVIHTIDEVRAVLRAHRAAGRTIALVPTMGALHDGHLSLVRLAREHADVVVVSVFVNPTQFNDQSDLAAYPRDEQRDVELACGAGAALVFAPSAAEMYPAGFGTSVQVSGHLTDTLEGAHRGSAHFHGVTTVVTKLLCIVGPDVAVFGAKDAQQVRVVEQLVRDLNLPVRIIRGETVREDDGLALSSRNTRLGTEARQHAVAISSALRLVGDMAAQGETDVALLIGAAATRLRENQIEPEYVAVADPVTLAPLHDLHGSDEALVLIAAPVGGVRLIDNTLIRVGALAGSSTAP